jgi:hypothetical protein
MHRLTSGADFPIGSVGKLRKLRGFGGLDPDGAAGQVATGMEMPPAKTPPVGIEEAHEASTAIGHGLPPVAIPALF